MRPHTRTGLGRERAGLKPPLQVKDPPRDPQVSGVKGGAPRDGRQRSRHRWWSFVVRGNTRDAILLVERVLVARERTRSQSSRRHPLVVSLRPNPSYALMNSLENHRDDAETLTPHGRCHTRLRMRKSAVIFYTVVLCALTGAASHARAFPPADASRLKSAIHEANVTEHVHYLRRRSGWHDASRHRGLRYQGPCYQRSSAAAGEPPYNPYYWASPARN
jgi:hypothetical protein